ncbi:MAG: universal stress protein [Hyphomicrobiales bacterium]|nr:MAG: universal stress protein [Hyphomicrobiales bacterium]
MFKHVLIATDGSELAGKGVVAGFELAKTVGAKVTVVIAIEPWKSMIVGEAAFSFPLEEYEKAAAETAATVLNAAKQLADKAQVACETLHVTNFPAEGIVETAEAKGCDLIVLTSHGRRGLARAFLGSQATRVLTLSKVPVLVYK